MKKNESSQFMKRSLLQFLVSVSLFSLILGYSLGFFFQPLSFAFSIDGKHMLMFLICNGILVFLAKSSTYSIPTSSASADQIKSSVDYHQHANVSSTDPDVAVDDDNDFIAQAQVEEGEKAEDFIQGMEARNEEVLSRDELNKKVEEFIRKMKEGIRIEAHQQMKSFAV